MIACIGWGRLIWDRRNLDADGRWRADGPTLPVKFARQSSEGRVTLVLVRGFEPILRCRTKTTREFSRSFVNTGAFFRTNLADSL